jgi:hypothetical protein
MNLQERFAELREEERHAIPPFAPSAPARSTWWRPAAAAFTVLLIVCVVLAVRPHRTTFTPADRAAARAVAAWRPPTDVLLRTLSIGVSR